MTVRDITSLTDDERQLLVVLVTKAWIEIREDEEMARAVGDLQSILRKISGVDKQVFVRTAR